MKTCNPLQGGAGRTGSRGLRSRGLLSREDALFFLRIGPTCLWRLTASGRIAHVRIGRRVLYRLQDLEAFVERQRREGSAPRGGSAPSARGP